MKIQIYKYKEWSYIHNYLFIYFFKKIQDVLKLRDQKQLDFEELTDYLQATTKERERAMHPSKYDGGNGYTLTGFLTDKLNEVRGADSEKIRREKILRLDDRIHEVSFNQMIIFLIKKINNGLLINLNIYQLQDAIEQTNEVSNAFSEQVKKENDYFVQSNSIEMHKALETYADAKVDFYQKVNIHIYIYMKSKKFN